MSSICAEINNPYRVDSIIVKDDCYKKILINETFVYSFDFDVFNNPPQKWSVNTEKSYPWDSDYINKQTWNNIWHKRLKYKLKGNSDVKVPWELGRGHLFTHIALGVLSGDIKQEHLFEVIDSFRLNNKTGYGVQWQCPMDVSIRLVNLILVDIVLKNSSLSINYNLFKVLEIAKNEHYLYIKKNLEVFDGGLKNNHYLTNLLAISWFESYEHKDREIKINVLAELKLEMNNQFLDDGSNFEGSVSYHFLSTEIMILAIIPILETCYKENYDYELIDLLKKITKAVGFCNCASSKKGHPSRIGDDDSGMILRPQNLSKVSIENRNKEITTRRLIAFNKFNELLHDSKTTDFLSPIVNILLGLDQTNLEKKITSHAYKDFGLYKYCKGNVELIFRHLSSLGSKGHGGHNHQDDSSIELFLNGDPLIVDPGTYCYTSDDEKRNYFRSHKRHNIVTTNKFEPFIVRKGQKGLFELKENIKSKSVFLSHDDYDEIKSNRYNDIVCRKLYKKDLRILDSVQNTDAQLRLHFYPGLLIKINKNGFTISDKLEVKFKGHKCIRLKKYYYSDYYLNERVAEMLEVDFTCTLATSFKEI